MHASGSIAIQPSHPIWMVSLDFAIPFVSCFYIIYTVEKKKKKNLMGWATQRGPRPRLVATSHGLGSCVIVSRFRTAMDLDTYPLSNFIRPRCAERAKRSRGKPVLIMYIGFLACFHAISLERSRFSKIASLIFVPL